MSFSLTYTYFPGTKCTFSIQIKQEKLFLNGHRFLPSMSLELYCANLSPLRFVHLPAAAAAKSLQSCPTLCDPIDGSPPGSAISGILQANAGVGCHFLLQCMKVKSQSEVAQSCPTQRPHGLQPTRLLRPWDFPGKSTGVGCHRQLLHFTQRPTGSKKWVTVPAL